MTQKFKIYFTNHAPVVMTINEIGNGELLKALYNENAGTVKEICEYTGLTDIDDIEIFRGDKVQIYDWGQGKEFLGESVIVWDVDCGCWQTEKTIIEDQYDFYTKANKRSFLVTGSIFDKP